MAGGASAETQAQEARARLARALASSTGFRGVYEVLSDAPSDPSLEEVALEVEAVRCQLIEADALLEADDAKGALEKFGSLEDSFLADCPSLIARIGQCYLALGETNRALNVSASLLRRDSKDVAAQLLQAEARFQATKEHIDSEAWDKEMDVAMRSTSQALALDPEHRGAAQLRRRLKSHRELVKKVRGAMSRAEFHQADELLSSVLDPARASAYPAQGKFAARCLAERGRARLQLGELERALADCVRAAQLDDRLTVAPVIQAQALQKSERWDDAVSVLEKLHEWNKDNDIFWKVEWAKFEVRRVRRPNYYEILGLETSCTCAQVKKAYLKQSVEFHPDKQRKNNPDLDPHEAEAKFKMISEAYEFLGDPAKRDYYDKGYDAQGIRECLAVRKRVAGQAPCSQCGEDEAGKMGADHNWYCLRCWDAYYRDKPEENPEAVAKDHAGQAGGAAASSVGPNSVRPNGCTRTKAHRAQAAAWPAGEPLPAHKDVNAMTIAELKSTLARMKVEPTGCLTKDDLRAFVHARLDELQALPAEPSEQTETIDPVVQPAEGAVDPAICEGVPFDSSHPKTSAQCAPSATPFVSHARGLAMSPPRCVATDSPQVASSSREARAAPEWSFSIAPAVTNSAADAWAGCAFDGFDNCVPTRPCAAPERPRIAFRDVDFEQVD